MHPLIFAAMLAGSPPTMIQSSEWIVYGRDNRGVIAVLKSSVVKRDDNVELEAVFVPSRSVSDAETWRYVVQRIEFNCRLQTVQELGETTYTPRGDLLERTPARAPVLLVPNTLHAGMAADTCDGAVEDRGESFNDIQSIIAFVDENARR